MPDLIRTFIAVKIEPEPDLLQLIKHFRKTLENEKIKWANENNLHLTLKFLGDTSPVQVERVKSILEETADNFSSFRFDLKGVGFFKRNRQPRVLFVNIEKNIILKQLAAEIDAKLSELGFEKEKREFNPHLTLGRIKFLKNKKAFYQAVEKHQETFFQTASINEIIFYRSILKPEGPEYMPLKIIK